MQSVHLHLVPSFHCACSVGSKKRKRQQEDAAAHDSFIAAAAADPHLFLHHAAAAGALHSATAMVVMQAHHAPLQLIHIKQQLADKWASLVELAARPTITSTGQKKVLAYVRSLKAPYRCHLVGFNNGVLLQ